jgi:hypothetical protein
VELTMQIYKWKRFWSPPTATINLSDDGFLVDPDTDWGRVVNPHLVSFTRTTDDLCLILLGEPGIGKSSAIDVAYKELQASCIGRSDEAVLFDLKPYGTEDRLVQNLFRNDSWRRWATGSHLLYLFIDSLDECRLRIANVTALLASELKKYPVDRLRLRIACRTAEWPVSFQTELETTYGAERVRVLELVPLRRADVVEALRANSIDADQFLSEVRRLGAVPFAIKPITLNFLVNVYRRGGQFPVTARELYFQGCRILCEEADPSRRESGVPSRLSAEARLAIAGRIAAVTVFSNRYAIWTDIDAGNVAAEDVPVSTMVGGHEGGSGQVVQATDAAIRETLATGLFSSRGAHRLGWSHSTYAEFLAAHYVTQRGLLLPQLLSLTVHPDDPEGKLVPQLHEVAGWIAGMSPPFLQEVLRREPEVLLRSDVAAADTEDRAKLVEGLLRLADQGLFMDTDWGRREQYARLAHPGLPDQVRPYVQGGDKHVVARRVAIDIAEACRLTELQNLLADIALDDSDQISARVNAAAAIRRIGDLPTKLRLKPLITGGRSDPDDELRGIALSALWPEQLTAREVFAVLTLPRDDSVIGVYRDFISRQIASHLKPSDLPIALDWVAAQPARHTMAFGVDELVTRILVEGWASIDAPGVLEAFAEAAFTRLKHHEGLFEPRTGRLPDVSAKLFEDAGKRHQVVASLVKLLAFPPLSMDPARAGVHIAISQLVSPADFHYLGDRFRSASGAEREIWSEIIKQSVPWNNPRALRSLVRLRTHSARLRAALPIWMLLLAAFFPPGFRLYQRWRAWWWQHDLPKPKAIKPPPAVRVMKLLRRCESGESIAWWALTRDMTLKPTSTHYGQLESDITVLPGWKAASPDTRQRILRAAERYLVEHDAQPSKWLRQNNTIFPAAAGYQALRLLQQEAPEAFRALPATIWSNWASIILAYPASVEPPDAELVRLALENAPGSFIETLSALIDVQSQADGSLRVIDRLGEGWTPAIAAALATKLGDPALHVRVMGRLLDILLEHDVPEARTFAASLVAGSSEETGTPSERSVTAGRALLTHARDGGWDVIWPRFQRDPLFGEAVISAVIDFHPVEDVIGRRLTEEQLGHLYVWLSGRYPHTEDPDISGMHSVSLREHIAYWRNDILNYLRLRGTPAAYQALREIQQALPGLGWLTWTLIEARALLRRREWVAPAPEHIVRLASAHTKRLVQSGRELLDVLVESLGRLEHELHGETGTVRFLWDTWTEGGVNRHRPKEENDFSDFVKVHLEHDLKERGVIVNREVEIRRKIGTGLGERTDIHVDAVVPGASADAYDTVSVIIETKGSWNRSVRTAMKNQLVGRYLKENRCRWGLYLVGWFNCDAWDPEDSRRADAGTMSRAQAESHFANQAASLCVSDLVVSAFVLNTALPQGSPTFT